MRSQSNSSTIFYMSLCFLAIVCWGRGLGTLREKVFMYCTWMPQTTTWKAFSLYWCHAHKSCPAWEHSGTNIPTLNT